MTKNQRKKWHDEAVETMDTLDPNKHNKENYLLYGASLAILNHGCASSIETTTNTEINAHTVNVEVMEPFVIDYVENSLIDEKIQERLQHFVSYMKEKSLEQTTGVELHGDYAEKALRDMLAIDEEIAVMLYNSADSVERQLIRQSYENILRNI